MPGPGDPETWPPYSGHPNDPRAYDDGRRDEAIDNRAAELLDTPEFTPYSPEHLSEALCEADDINPICLLLAAGDLAGAGVALNEAARRYWGSVARKEAERQIDEEAAHVCHRCRGHGCRRCRED